MTIDSSPARNQIVDNYLNRLSDAVDRLNRDSVSDFNVEIFDRCNAAAEALHLLGERLEDWKYGLPNQQFDQLSGLDETPFEDPTLADKISKARVKGDLFIYNKGKIIPVLPRFTTCEPLGATSKNEVKKIELVGVVDNKHVFKETDLDGTICYIVRIYYQPPGLPLLPTEFKRGATEQEVQQAKENATN